MARGRADEVETLLLEEWKRVLGPQPFPDLLLVEGYTVETGILDGMDETYKMFALFQRED